MMAMNHVNCVLMAVGKMRQESLFVTTAPTAPIQEGKEPLIPMNVWTMSSWAVFYWEKYGT
jgi:hypothetical protein